MGDLDRALALLTVDRPVEARAVAEAATQRARQWGQAYLVARGLAVLAAGESGPGEYRRVGRLPGGGAAHAPRARLQATAGAGLSSILPAPRGLLLDRAAASL